MAKTIDSIFTEEESRIPNDPSKNIHYYINMLFSVTSTALISSQHNKRESAFRSAIRGTHVYLHIIKNHPGFTPQLQAKHFKDLDKKSHQCLALLEDLTPIVKNRLKQGLPIDDEINIQRSMHPNFVVGATTQSTPDEERSATNKELVIANTSLNYSIALPSPSTPSAGTHTPVPLPLSSQNPPDTANQTTNEQWWEKEGKNTTFQLSYESSKKLSLTQSNEPSFASQSQYVPPQNNTQYQFVPPPKQQTTLQQSALNIPQNPSPSSNLSPTAPISFGQPPQNPPPQQSVVSFLPPPSATKITYPPPPQPHPSNPAPFQQPSPTALVPSGYPPMQQQYRMVTHANQGIPSSLLNHDPNKPFLGPSSSSVSQVALNSNFAPSGVDIHTTLLIPEASMMTQATGPVRHVFLSSALFQMFIQAAHYNNSINIETCGILCGRMVDVPIQFLARFSKGMVNTPNTPTVSVLLITQIVMPPQHGTSDTVVAEKEEVLEEHITSSNELIMIGWIHTHPTQKAFLSSIDLHTHLPYQMMMPESIAIVVAIREASVAVFTLSSVGEAVLRKCPLSGFHRHEGEQLPSRPFYGIATHATVLDGSQWTGFTREIIGISRDLPSNHFLAGLSEHDWELKLVDLRGR
ncbi:putative STAM-binding protein [Blattamonas nauphoetae]|uniref:STAM-binding protein n=1 Tax=Blattamonas nauphoetae TaxID=2049346 RepID=A0ABQ9Y4W6_9EUKA|nr:putative STAM-binding protein [Blattamonas nauphoetae]